MREFPRIPSSARAEPIPIAITRSANSAGSSGQAPRAWTFLRPAGRHPAHRLEGQRRHPGGRGFYPRSIGRTTGFIRPRMPRACRLSIAINAIVRTILEGWDVSSRRQRCVNAHRASISKEPRPIRKISAPRGIGPACHALGRIGDRGFFPARAPASERSGRRNGYQSR